MPVRFAVHTLVATLFVAGCSSPGEEAEDSRRAANQAYNEGLTAFDSKDYSAAEAKFTAALEAHGLNPDSYIDATVKRAVCWAATGKPAEALAELDKLASGGGPEDQILAARAYVLGKQGKAREARAALAKARQYNPRVQEFKD